MGETKIGNAEVIDEGIVDLDVIPLEEDGLSITEKAAEVVEEENEIIDDEGLDTEESEEEEEELAEEDKEEEPAEEKEDAEVEKKEAPINKAKNIEIDKEISSLQKEMKDVSNTLKMISESIPEAPERPSDPDDDEAMAQYRIDLAVHKSQLHQFKTQQAMAREKAKQLSLRQENIFREKHKGEDLSGFENWMAESIELQTSYYIGSRSLDTLYKWYKVETGETEKEGKELKQIKKKGVKFEPVSTKSKGDSAVSGGNGFPVQYKYANLPMFKDLVKSYKGKKSNITGEKYTPKYINELCRQEYKLTKGLSII